MRCRIPITVSVLAHGVLAATLFFAKDDRPKPAPSPTPTRIRIHFPETETIRREPEPTAVHEAPPEKAQTRGNRKKKGRARVSSEAPGLEPVITGDSEGTMIVEGTKTEEKRGTAALDLSPHLSIPRFEEQGPGVRPPPPARDRKRKPRAGGGFRYDDRTFKAEVAEDGTVVFGDGGYDGEDKGPFKFTLDVNDLLLSALGDDPYSYEKRRFIEATREERLEMARVACGRRLSLTLVELPKRLDHIRMSARSDQEKREILFDLWDECAEDGSDEVVRYGELARATILHFINEHFPAQGEQAYSAIELEALNRRRYSKRPFEPYTKKAL